MIARQFRKLQWNRITAGLPRLQRPPANEPYFGQYGQDRYVTELFGNQRDLFFIDIGANDGITFSNTYFLETRLGWSGIAFEPHPGVYKKLAEARRCTTIHAGVGPEAGVMRFCCVDGDANMLSGFCNTFDKTHRRRITRSVRKNSSLVREIDISVVRLADEMARQQRDLIDYLSLDTEGGELNILRSIDFQNIRVRCVSVENNDKRLDVYRYLRSCGFELKAVAGCDEIYVHRSVLVKPLAT